MPSFRLSAERVGVQPAAGVRHVQRHGHEQHVRSALLPVPCLQSAQSSPPLYSACTTVAFRPPASRAAPRPASYAPLSTLGSKRLRSTSR
eukprot:scaffold37323_cov45-Phaeocystis_antarctica.AAC.1